MRAESQASVISREQAFQRWRATVVACVLLAPAGCGDSTAPYLPVVWWRQLEGGRIAEARPPPPRADAPYPSLGIIPPRPPGTDAASRARIAGDLVSDRAAAMYASRIAPLVATAPQATKTPAPQPAPGPEDSTATLAAASNPPAPAPTGGSTQVRPAAITTPGAGRPAAPISELPYLPAQPPPPPSLPGVMTVTMPMRPPAPPLPPKPEVPPAAPGAPLAIAFGAQGAVLPDGAAAALRQLASRRGAAVVVVSGYGEAEAAGPDAQAAALPLALARAQSMRTVLSMAGVPDASIRVSAEALGHGGVARIAE